MSMHASRLTLRSPLGFDLEWRVIFMFRAAQRKAAILQLCDKERILIIQLSAMKGTWYKYVLVISLMFTLAFPCKVKVSASLSFREMNLNVLFCLGGY